MPLIQVSDLQHKWLKGFAQANDTTMTAILRMALEAYAANPAPILRAKRWFVQMYLWEDGGLVKESVPAEVENTGELPALAESFVGVPGVASLVLADLQRLRQVLARVHSTSARIPNNDGSMLLQIDVHRERPAE